jgi:hypothetical protein
MSKERIVAGYAWDVMTPVAASEGSMAVTLDDLQKYADEINTGKHPLYLEHRHPISRKLPAYPVGRLIEASVDKVKSTLKVTAALDDNERGRTVYKAVTAKDLNGFSLGIDHTSMGDGPDVKYDKKFVECSIVARPEHAAAMITGVREVLVFGAHDVDPETQKKQESLWEALQALEKIPPLEASEHEKKQKTDSALPQSLPSDQEIKPSEKMATDPQVATDPQMANFLKMLAKAVAPVIAPTPAAPAEPAVLPQDYAQYMQFQAFKKMQAEAAAAAAATPAPALTAPASVPVTPAVPAPTPMSTDDIERLVEEKVKKRLAEAARPREQARTKLSDTKAAPAVKKEQPLEDAEAMLGTLKSLTLDEKTKQFNERFEQVKQLSDRLAEKRAQISVLQTQVGENTQEELEAAAAERNEIERNYNEMAKALVADVRNDVSRVYSSQGLNTPDHLSAKLIDIENSQRMPVGQVENAMLMHNAISTSSAAFGSSLELVNQRHQDVVRKYKMSVQKEMEDREIAKTRGDHAAASRMQKLDNKARVGMEMDEQVATQAAVANTQKTIEDKNAVISALEMLAKAQKLEINIDRYKPSGAPPIGKSDGFEGYDPLTKRPIGKNPSQMSFVEISGIPWQIVDASTNVNETAAAMQLRGFRQKKPFNTVREAPELKKVADGQVGFLNNVFSTGNAKVIEDISQSDAAPETGRALELELQKFAQSNKWKTEDVSIGNHTVKLYQIGTNSSDF